MSVDKFGRSSLHFQQKHGFLEVLYDEDEVLDAKKRRIINVEPPLKSNDTATKFYVDSKVDESIIKTENILNSTFKLSYDEKINSCLHEEKARLFEIIKNYELEGISLKEPEVVQPGKKVHRLILRAISDILSQWQTTMPSKPS